MFRPFPTTSDAIKGYGVSISMLVVWCLSIVLPSNSIVRVRPIAEYSSTVPVIPPETIQVLTEASVAQSSEQGAAAEGPSESQATDGNYKAVAELRDDDMPVIQTAEPMSDPGWTDPTHVIGQDPGGPSRFRVSVPVVPEEAAPIDPQVTAVEQEPEVDMASLRDAIRYPDQAKRNGIEGSVVVRALIDKSGRIVQAEIYASEHALLEQAALEGVRKARFTAAQQNGRAVSCWVYVPVVFRLR